MTTTTETCPVQQAIAANATKWQTEAAKLVRQLTSEGWFGGKMDDGENLYSRDIDEEDEIANASESLADDMREFYRKRFASELDEEPGLFDDVSFQSAAVEFVKEQV